MALTDRKRSIQILSCSNNGKIKDDDLRFIDIDLYNDDIRFRWHLVKHFLSPLEFKSFWGINGEFNEEDINKSIQRLTEIGCVPIRMGIDKYIHENEKHCRECNKGFNKRYNKCTKEVEKYELTFIQRIVDAIRDCGYIPRYAIFKKNSKLRGIGNQLKIVADKHNVFKSMLNLTTCYYNIKKTTGHMIRSMIAEIDSKANDEPAHYCEIVKWKPYMK